jgi:hypothetical protein
MSNKSLVERNVATAFRLLKDLREDIVLNQSRLTEFNFNDLEVETQSLGTLTVQGVIVKSYSKPVIGDLENGSIMQFADVIISSVGISNINEYTKVTMRGSEWLINNIENYRYAYILKCGRTL